MNPGDLRTPRTSVVGVCQGEDYRHWRLLIRDGQVVEQVGRVIYGDLYDAFLEEYPALPESIKIKLNSWWVLQHL